MQKELEPLTSKTSGSEKRSFSEWKMSFSSQSVNKGDIDATFWWESGVSKNYTFKIPVVCVNFSAVEITQVAWSFQLSKADKPNILGGIPPCSFLFFQQKFWIFESVFPVEKCSRFLQLWTCRSRTVTFFYGMQIFFSNYRWPSSMKEDGASSSTPAFDIFSFGKCTIFAA